MRATTTQRKLSVTSVPVLPKLSICGCLGRPAHQASRADSEFGIRELALSAYILRHLPQAQGSGCQACIGAHAAWPREHDIELFSAIRARIAPVGGDNLDEAHMRKEAKVCNDDDVKVPRSSKSSEIERVITGLSAGTGQSSSARR